MERFFFERQSALVAAVNQGVAQRDFPAVRAAFSNHLDLTIDDETRSYLLDFLTDYQIPAQEVLDFIDSTKLYSHTEIFDELWEKYDYWAKEGSFGKLFYGTDFLVEAVNFLIVANLTNYLPKVVEGIFAATDIDDPSGNLPKELPKVLRKLHENFPEVVSKEVVFEFESGVAL